MSIATAAGRGGRIIGLTLQLQSKGAEKVQIFQSASPRSMESRWCCGGSTHSTGAAWTPRALPLLFDPMEPLHDFGDDGLQFLKLIAVKVEPEGDEPFAIG